jgi:hypothetical protein
MCHGKRRTEREMNWNEWLESKKQAHDQIKTVAAPEVPPYEIATARAISIVPYPMHKSKRGAHWSASCYPCHANYQYHLDKMKEIGVGYVKYLSDGNGRPGVGDSGLRFGIDVAARDMVPVVRYYMSADHRWSDANDYATEMNVKHGIVCIETINEPDLNYEWDDGKLPQDWAEKAFRNWIEHARRIIDHGGIPLSPSLASGFIQARGDGAGQLTINPFKMVKEAGIERFICSTHNYPLNHPIDYPYDKVNQEGQFLNEEEWNRVGGEYAWDGQTVAQINSWRYTDKNPGDDIYDDDSCFRACDIFRDLLKEAGYEDVPIITTEGGPCLTDRHDRRYPRITPVVMQEMIEAELQWMADKDWYLGYCWWLWGNPNIGGTGGWGTNQWYWPGGPFSDGNGFIPIVQYLKDKPIEGGGNGDNGDDGDNGGHVEPTDRPELSWTIPDWNDAQHVAAIPDPGQKVYVLVEAKLAEDTMANTIFINVYDRTGQRANVQVKTENANGAVLTLPFKPTDPYDQPMNKNDRFKVWIEGGSDIVTDLHGVYFGIEGVNTFHVGYVLTFVEWTAPEDEEPEPQPEETLEQFVRRSSWDAVGVNYNPEAAFVKYAEDMVLGKPESNEFDIKWNGNTYRVQAFTDGIVYCLVGDWQNIQFIPWA